MKLRSRKVSEVGTLEMSSVSTLCFVNNASFFQIIRRNLPNTRESTSLVEHRLQSLGVLNINRNLCGQLALEGKRVFARSSPGKRVQQDTAFKLSSVRRSVLYLHHVVVDKSRGHSRIGVEFTVLSSLLVRLELMGLESSEQVSRVNNGDLATDLTETERGEKTALESNVLNGFRGIEEVREGTELFRDVVGIVVTGNKSAVNGLAHAVEHPSGSTTLGMTGQALLSNNGDGITRSSAKLLELKVVDTRLILVVSLSTGTVARDGTDAVGIKTPNGKGTTQRCDVGVGTLEHTKGSKSLLLLPLGLIIDERHSVLEPLLVVPNLSSLELHTEKFVLVLKPLRDLLASESELSRSVLDIEQGQSLFGSDFTGSREDTSTGSRDRSTSLVSVGGAVGDNTLD